MPAYRYHRVRVDSTVSGYVTLTEFQAATTSGGTDIAPSGTLTASSTFSTFTVSNLLDADSNTHWISDFGSLPETVTLDSGSAVTLHEIRLSSRDGVTEYPLHFYIDGSADGSTWTVLREFTVAPAAWGPSGLLTFELVEVVGDVVVTSVAAQSLTGDASSAGALRVSQVASQVLLETGSDVGALRVSAVGLMVLVPGTFNVAFRRRNMGVV